MANYGDIYVHKRPIDGATPINAQSPANEAAPSPKRGIKSATLLGYGSLLANRTITTVVDEIRKGGNEELSTTLTNIARGGTLIAAAVATSGLSLIPEAISSASQQLIRYRNAQRETRLAQYETNLKGSRVNFNQGRVYFD